jgi:hypothetical protein
MNAGFIALIGTWFMVLFLLSGLLDRYMINKTNKKIFFFVLVIYLLGAAWSIQVFETARISIVAFLLPLILAVVFWARQEDKLRLHILTASFLVGTSLFFLQLIIRMDPILMFVNEPYMMAILVILLIVISTRQLIQQYILLAFSFAINDLLFQFYMWELRHVFYLGSPEFRDVWWISLYSLIMARSVLSWKWVSFFRRKRAHTSG